MSDLFSADLLTSLVTLAQDAPRPVPEDDEVKAGYVALFLWLGMCVAVALLGWSLIRQIRRTSAAKDAGVYGDPVEGGTTRREDDVTADVTAGAIADETPSEDAASER
ncbi:hypothetical protein [Nocardioides jishulii]|uniref:CcmD family protein n=1 Tax=Nocardioides jishulii TaxID=2575440 RepID=A0A4U2YI69_9ACTN|nr:hypothetical protein [Nocardioides jishulii]QCX26686.1 hypothetical protein FCL41_03345 [Nocardioides jishulii]TKI60344.1 hypothetical protein FC770_16205 [Nocardioides jishulii]